MTTDLLIAIIFAAPILVVGGMCLQLVIDRRKTKRGRKS